MMTKEQLIFHLRRARNNTTVPSQEEMAKQGMPYNARQAGEEHREELNAHAEAIGIALELAEKYYHV